MYGFFLILDFNSVPPDTNLKIKKITSSEENILGLTRIDFGLAYFTVRTGSSH